MGRRILLIKLGALGDVIRTEALLPGLKDAYPQSQITWVSKSNGCRMLANNPLIDRLLEFNAETMCQLRSEHFDLVINLDKESAPAGLAMQVTAQERRGIGLSPCGTAYPLNPEAHYYFALGLSDELKFRQNSFSYQRLIYDAVGLTYRDQIYRLYPTPQNYQHARTVYDRESLKNGEEVIGLNTGSGGGFANKTWGEEKFLELARQLMARGDCRVALLGGPDETDRNRRLKQQLGPEVIDTGCDNSELDFAAIVHRCSAVLTGDTTATHVAIALRVPTVILFGPTCPQEIDVYGRGYKLISGATCAPCYKRHCDHSPNCMDTIDAESAYEVLIRYLGRSPVSWIESYVPEPHEEVPTCR